MKVIVNNLATEYKDNGNGPVILLLHGWKDRLETFDSLTSLLGDKYRVVRLDLPGFGQTESAPLPWSVRDYANFVSDFTRKLDIKVECLIGHSFGGRIIIKGVSEQVLTPQKIVLIASGGISKSKTVRNQLFKIAAKAGNIISYIPPFNFFRKQLRFQLYKRSGSDYLAAGSLKGTYLQAIGEDLAKAASSIGLPTLLIWGSLDTETPLSDGLAFHKAIPISTLMTVAGSGHFVHQESAEKVAAAIKEFMEHA